jgi:hypothetical protein
MSDFELLKSLQNELIETLEDRKTVEQWIPRTCCKAKIRRLRLQIQEVMLRIENKCEGCIKYDKENWE